MNPMELWQRATAEAEAFQEALKEKSPDDVGERLKGLADIIDEAQAATPKTLDDLTRSEVKRTHDAVVRTMTIARARLDACSKLLSLFRTDAKAGSVIDL